MKNNTPPRATRASRATRDPYGMPTPEQLATLAAHLAKGSNVTSRPEFQLLAYYAMNLWQAAEMVHHEWSGNYRSPLDNAEYLATLPQQYPILLNHFLIRVLPDARPEDRRRAWKHYNLLQAGIDPKKATAAQDNEAAGKWVSPIGHSDFILKQLHFLNWWKPYRAAEVKKSKSEARQNVLAKKKNKTKSPKLLKKS